MEVLLSRKKKTNVFPRSWRSRPTDSWSPCRAHQPRSTTSFDCFFNLYRSKGLVVFESEASLPAAVGLNGADLNGAKIEVTD